MPTDNNFPENPFWDFSLAAYALPGVADACLYLQDQYGLNVNLLLLCVWSGAQGPGRLSAELVSACAQRTRDWQMTVVQPIRAIRHACRDAPLGMPDDLLDTFRPRVQAVELDSEHVEQLVLADMVGVQRGAVSTIGANADRNAACNLEAYLDTEGIHADEQLCDCVRIILRAVFPAADVAGWRSFAD